MPLEIRELHIKVNVSEAQGGSVAGVSGAKSSQGDATGERDRLLADCVEEILTLLERRQER
jgi:hypothetical protein